MTKLPLSPGEHETSAKVDEGLAWLKTTPREQRPGSVVGHLKALGLTTSEACQAIAEFNRWLARAQ